MRLRVIAILCFSLFWIFLAVVFFTRHQVADFSATAEYSNQVVLRWTANYSLHLKGFYVLRSEDGNIYNHISPLIRPLSENFESSRYSFRDERIVLVGEPYFYRLEVVFDNLDSIYMEARPVVMASHTPTKPSRIITPTYPIVLDISAIPRTSTLGLRTPTPGPVTSGGGGPPGLGPPDDSPIPPVQPGGPILYPPGYSSPIPTQPNLPGAPPGFGPGSLPPGPAATFSAPPGAPPGFIPGSQGSGTIIAPFPGMTTNQPQGVSPTIPTVGTQNPNLNGRSTQAFLGTNVPDREFVDYQEGFHNTRTSATGESMEREKPSGFSQLMIQGISILGIGLSIWYFALRQQG